MKPHVALLKITLLFTLILAGCQGSPDKKTRLLQLPQELFRDGDITFRRGTGITSRVVLAADREGTYSHTGILKKKDGPCCARRTGFQRRSGSCKNGDS